jgi:cysteine-rich repeat protein
MQVPCERLILACSFLAASIFFASGAAVGATLGDANADGVVDISDVQCTVLASLVVLPPPCLLDGKAIDVDCSGQVDVADIQLVVSLALSFPQAVLPAESDANGNGQHDDCEGSFCGDGVVDEGEQCDDGNALWGDGCAPNCEEEAGMDLVLIEGTVIFGGDVGPADELTIMISLVQVDDVYEYPEGSLYGASAQLGPVFPFEYQLQVAPGTYYLSAVLNKGGTEGFGPEDPATIYPYAVSVDTSDWASGVDMDLLGSTGEGQVSGTLTLTGGEAAPDDLLRVILSTTAPPAVTVSRELQFKPVVFPQAYTFEGVGTGTFYVLAQLDVGDDSAEEPGAEDFVGLYPSFMNPQTVTLGPGEMVENIDFSLGPSPF